MQTNGSIFDQMKMLKGLFSGDPQKAVEGMCAANPQFKEFVGKIKNEGITPEEAFKKYGLNESDVRKKLGM